MYRLARAVVAFSMIGILTILSACASTKYDAEKGLTNLSCFGICHYVLVSTDVDANKELVTLNKGIVDIETLPTLKPVLPQ